MTPYSKHRRALHCFLALSSLLPAPYAVAQNAAAAAADSAAPGSVRKSSAAASARDMKAMMKDMSEQMSSMPMTGHTDVNFAAMMRMHHQGAIDMAEAELRDGTEPQMRALAKSIIAAQKKEIAQIDKFLAKQGQPPAN
jgi:uncharacterized protein (DUF305 family)